MFALIGIIMILVTSVCVKKFDKEIREYQWRKVLVNISMISGFLLTLSGLVLLLVR